MKCIFYFYFYLFSFIFIFIHVENHMINFQTNNSKILLTPKSDKNITYDQQKVYN